MNATPEKHLEKTTFFLMLGTAILIDCITWIPVLGSVVNFVAIIGFWFWFTIHGIKFNKKRITTFATGSIVELIPFIQVLPAWTLMIVVMYFQSKLPPIVQSALGGNVGGVTNNLIKPPVTINSVGLTTSPQPPNQPSIPRPTLNDINRKNVVKRVDSGAISVNKKAT